MMPSALAIIAIIGVVAGLYVYQTTLQTLLTESPKVVTPQPKQTQTEPYSSPAPTPQKAIDKCADVTCELNSKSCPDGIVARCEQKCNPEAGVCDNCIPDCTGHEKIKSELYSFTDTFDGTTIDATKYSTKITGKGSITQNNEIIQTGNAVNEIIWNIFYTNQNLSFAKDFTITVDVKLDSSVSSGDGMSIVGVEDRSVVLGGMKPTAGFCELSVSSHGTTIRMSGSGEHMTTVSTTSGKMELSYSAAKSTLTCSFGGQTVTESRQPKAGELALTLRAGLHTITPGNEAESSGSGTFAVKFDNLKVVIG